MKGVKRSITVEGLNLERFIRQAGEKGVIFRRAIRRGRKYTILVQEEQIPLLVEIAQQGGWRFTVGERQGVGRYVNITRRHWLFIGLSLVAGVCVLLASQVMWSVSLVDAGPYQADAQAYLHEAGIRAPMWKRDVLLAELRDLLEWRYPEVAWIDCGWRGTTLRINFLPGIPTEGDRSTGPRDVVASRGGIVESVVTLAGTPAVTPGDVITSGQLLIHGYERGKDETQTPVSARGVVKARVWDNASACVSICETQTRYTGRQHTTWYVACGLFPLWKPADSPYEHFDISKKTVTLGGLFFPFTLHFEERMEYTLEDMQRSMEDVQREAREAAQKLLREKTGFDDDFVDKWVDYCMIEDEEVCAVAYGERIVDVACYAQPSN